MKLLTLSIATFAITQLGAMNQMDYGTFNERMAQLRERLENSAYRRGISVGIQGTMKIAPSDHMPISIKFDDISIASWNLLTDQFTWNYFRDVGEKPYFADVKRDGKALDWRTLFSDFGNFVFNNSEIKKDENNEDYYDIKITKEFLNSFLAEKRLKHQQLKEKLIQDENYDAKIKRSEGTMKDAEIFVDLVLDSTNPNHGDIQTSIRHAIEIKYAYTKGYLRWEERLQKIKENKFLVENLASHNFFCFQECTEPQDMLTLLKNKNGDKNLAMLSHAVEEETKDNCVIIYDQNKYELEQLSNFGLANNSKPCIIAKFRSLENNTSIIIGSIHHSGRGKSELKFILEKVNLLLQGNEDIPILLLGDYNHQRPFYANDLIDSDFDLKMPSGPTMAGLEHGNLNKAIDGVLTNRPTETTVEVLPQGTFASQVVLPFKIEFEF